MMKSGITLDVIKISPVSTTLPRAEVKAESDKKNEGEM